MSQQIATLDAQNVLFMVGDYGLGVRPSLARIRLIRGIQRASAAERLFIALRFPGLVQAVRMTAGTDGLEALRTLVKDRTEAVAA